MSIETETRTTSGPSPHSLGSWRLKDFGLGEGERTRAFDAELGDWIAAEAPGDVYLALAAAGRIVDPFGDRAEQGCAWVVDREWWWRTEFAAPSLAAGQRLILEFEGLDTFADVWLNGERIASSDNMFRPLRLDLTGHARPGSNQLAVSFAPVATPVAGKTPLPWPFGGDSIAKTNRNFIRKAQFGWGWDWGPTLPTVGIWKPVTLKVETAAALAQVVFTTLEISPEQDLAKVRIAVTADAFGGVTSLIAEIELRAHDGSLAAQRLLKLAGGSASVEVDLPSAALWWTPELGAANLYGLAVTLVADGVAVDQRRLRVGVRTVALDQSPDPDEPGATFFRFVLNGVSIFARGACWIPASSFVAAVDEPHYRKLLQLAADANMNMIRIWGGGVYEHDAFYDVCDELGLLVWQDFMFACAPYPEDDPAFVASVTAEVKVQVERLRHHPSLALWCGNNECQVMGGLSSDKRRLAGDLYYEDIMPKIVAELDPTTPYWPGSPYGGPHANSMIAGDVHDWTVWHGVPPVPVDRMVGQFSIAPENVAYTRYAEDMTRFVSEYGIQASPAMETLRRAIPEDQRSYNSPALLARIKDHPKNKVDAMLVTVTGLPTDLQDYVDFTQITQAEGLKFGIEHFRRRTPHCSGSLIWQLNDCWPGISWSLVDYYGFGKASYYYVKRAYAPVMASFKAGDEGAIELWVVNDHNAPVSTSAEIAFASFAGETHWTTTVAVDVGPTESRCVWRGKAAGGPGDVISIRSANDAFPPNRWFFAPIKDLARDPPAAPTASFKSLGRRQLQVTVSAKAHLWFVHLLVNDEATRFSDNYFDLMAGETRRITVTHPSDALTEADVPIRWR
jgi:beta-mannosidase